MNTNTNTVINNYNDLLLNQIDKKKFIKFTLISNGIEKLIKGSISFISNNEIMVDYIENNKLLRQRLWHNEIGITIKKIELSDNSF